MGFPAEVRLQLHSRASVEMSGLLTARIAGRCLSPCLSPAGEIPEDRGTYRNEGLHKGACLGLLTNLLICTRTRTLTPCSCHGHILVPNRMVTNMS